MNFIHVCRVVGCTLCAVWEQCEFTRRNLVHKTTYFHSWARANFLTLGQTLQRIKASVAQQNTKPNTKKKRNKIRNKIRIKIRNKIRNQKRNKIRNQIQNKLQNKIRKNTKQNTKNVCVYPLESIWSLDTIFSSNATGLKTVSDCR